MGRRVLVVGSGGREHALAWRLATSASVDAVEAAPGNPGVEQLGPCHDVPAEDRRAIVELAEERGIDLVVIGPEAPLVAGLADDLRDAGIPTFGPSAEAARLEGSKSFAKEVMQAAGAPTGRYGVYSDPDEATAALDGYEPPYVVKADGLAAGKGVVIAETREDARAAIVDALVRRRFGAAGEEVVIEEFLDGPEASVFGICDGTDVALLPPSQDFKRARDGDEGPNTGGMGAYTPVAGFGLDEAKALETSVFRPVLQEMSDRGAPYRGLLYAGLVLTADGPQVLEFNCRFGDPETQALLPRIDGDFADLLDAAVDPTRGLRNADCVFSDDACVTVVLASGGYPGTYDVGRRISGLDAVADAYPGALVFHAGTRRVDDELVTSGGRVLAVTGRGDTVASAREQAYAAADLITWDDQHRREDIAASAG